MPDRSTVKLQERSSPRRSHLGLSTCYLGVPLLWSLRTAAPLALGLELMLGLASMETSESGKKRKSAVETGEKGNMVKHEGEDCLATWFPK